MDAKIWSDDIFPELYRPTQSHERQRSPTNHEMLPRMFYGVQLGTASKQSMTKKNGKITKVSLIAQKFMNNPT